MARSSQREDAATIAARIAEDVRALNYATLPHEGFPGLVWPVDAHNTIGALMTAVGRLPQALGQISAFLAAQKRRPGLADRYSEFAGRPYAAIDVARADLDAAARTADRVHLRLEAAHNASAGLSIDDPDNRR